MSSNEPALLTDNPIVNEFYDNTQSNIIRITDDKLKVILLDNKESLIKNNDFIAPLTLFISLILTFCTTDFNNFLTITASTWKALYLFFTLSSAIWLLVELRKRKKSITIDELINKVRNPKNQIVKTDQSSNSSSIQNIVIYSAKYGADTEWIDLTQKITELVGRNILGFVISNEFAGKDPLPGKGKQLQIHCSINGTNKMISANEGAPIKIE